MYFNLGHLVEIGPNSLNTYVSYVESCLPLARLQSHECMICVKCIYYVE